VSNQTQDTIVAIATPPGQGAVGIVRLSGPRAIGIATPYVLLKHPLNQLESYQLRYARLRLDDELSDEALVFVARAPKTYTGEDTVEFQCHGSPALLSRLVRSLESAGARAAEPGEFTKRAFLNGKIDLTQAEAVADLISATTDVSLASAYFQLRGGLRSRFEDLSKELIQTKTLLEANLDFSEDVRVDPAAVSDQLQRVADVLGDQIASYDGGKLIRRGAIVSLCGIPNVGKSSLMNALLGQERAIVTDVPGTTRDTIEESIEIGGIQIVLTDTAGIRETTDPVELEGTRRSAEALASADVVILVCDGHDPPNPEYRKLIAQHQPAIVVLNKSDLGINTEWVEQGDAADRVRLSAHTGEGLDALRTALHKHLIEAGAPNTESVTNERHWIALKQAREALTKASAAISQGAPGEIVSFEIDESLGALSSIIGETTAQDILDQIFSQFCIGK